MKYNSQKHHRRSTRLKDYDYSQSGTYFVTICAHNRACLFGNITDNKMILSTIGEIARNILSEIPAHFHNVELDRHVIMPNHIHGIIIIKQNNNPGLIYRPHENNHCCMDSIDRTKENNYRRRGLINQTPTHWILMKNANVTLGKIIRHFKAKSTKFIHNNGHSSFKWQRNYYEHIIRNEKELHGIRHYIIHNLLKWDLDRENPQSRDFNIDYEDYFRGIYEQ